MAKDSNPLRSEREPFSVRFNLASLVVFSMALIIASGGLVFALLHRDAANGNSNPKGQLTTVAAAAPDSAPTVVPPWGELVTYDMEIEHPEEYAASQRELSPLPTWVFDGVTFEYIQPLLQKCGLTAAQIKRALAPERVTKTASNTLIHPDRELVLSLAPEARGNLYAELAGSPANLFMFFPACFTGNSFALNMYGSKVDEKTVALVKPLLYPRGGVTFFSDFEVVMSQLPSEPERVKLMKALSAQPGVLARVRIRPTTDVDKLLGYWTQTPGVRLKDLRPLLESIKRIPEGATISVLYFLPPFARERLYTFPMPPKAGDPAMDCHWSSMNFFNEEPDNRLSDPRYVSEKLTQEYYLVQRPTKYGDLIVLADERGNGIHSAVYVADDIVFTKNGNNYIQPWMLMRLNNLLAKYSIRGMPRLLVYRSKES